MKKKNPTKGDLLEESGRLVKRLLDLEVQASESENRLQHFLAATGEGVLLHERGRVVDVNLAGAEMFGYRPEELIGRDLLCLASADNRRAMAARIESDLEGIYQVLGVRKDGSSFPVELDVRNVSVGGKIVRAVAARDLTERRATEKELRDSREGYRSVLGNLRGIAYRTIVGNGWPSVMIGNVVEMTGRPSSDFLDGIIRWEEIIHPDDRVRVAAEIAWLTAEGPTAHSSFSYRIVRRCGALRWVRDFARLTKGESREEPALEGLVVDVTAEKEIEEELRRTRDNLLRTEQLARIGSWAWDLQGDATSWSPGMYQLYRLSPDDARSPKEIAMSAIHPDDMPRLREHMLRAAGSGSVAPIEYRVKVGDSIRYHRTEGEVVRHPETGSIRMMGFVQDVTALKQAEEERRLAEEERDRLFDMSIAIVKGAAEGLAVCHEVPEYPSLAFTVWNDRMCEITGYTMEEINELGWYQTVYPDPEVRERARARMELMRKGDDLDGEEWVVTRKDGERRVLRISTSVLRVPNQESVHVLALMEDVTERRRAEEALRKSEERYRSLIEEAPYGIFRATMDGRLLAVNRALAAMLGYASASELLATSVIDRYQDPDEWRRLVAEHESVRRIPELEVGWTRRDGIPITVRLNGRTLIGSDGSLDELEVICEDVTERRLLEEQFRQSQKMEAVGRLAGGIAHDFNNLLTAVTGYADLLRARIPLDDPRRPYVDEIGGAADRASGLTRQLLAFSRRQILQPRVVDLDGIVRSVERMLGRIIGEDIELVTTLEALGHVRADGSQLEQVVLNLAVNARDAMPQGGRIEIETRDVEVSEGFRLKRAPMPPGAYVLLAVTDTGSGMDPVAMAHIFEPFFTSKDPGKGTGLGLATVYGIVKQSEGFIWATSAPGKGARFEIYLPRVDREAEVVPPAPQPVLEGGSETILLVEDEAGVRRVLSEMLEWHGYTVLEAGLGAEAVELARTHAGPVHLLLTDVVMPRLGGRALREEVARHRPGIRVLYISGYTGEGPTADLLGDGAAFLPKPFTAATLVQKVREVLGGPMGYESPPAV
jgi:PAS domain S-box-containing protein